MKQMIPRTEYIVHHEDDEQPKHKSKGEEELGGEMQAEEHVRQRQTDRVKRVLRKTETDRQIRVKRVQMKTDR